MDPGPRIKTPHGPMVPTISGFNPCELAMGFYWARPELQVLGGMELAGCYINKP